jgi:hypothetical protein
MKTDRQENPNAERLEMIDALNGCNIEALKNMKKEKVKACKGSLIFAEKNEDGNIRVNAMCLGWFGFNKKTLTPEQFDDLVKVYEFNVLYLSLEK